MEFFYWKKFAESGNVLDYLNYKQVQNSKKHKSVETQVLNWEQRS